GVCTSRQAYDYLNGQVQVDDPFQINGMDETVIRLLWAIDHHEPVAVYGDYDVDGVTATALLTQVLRRFGAVVTPYIPNRFDEGYGLNMEALEGLAGQGIRVVVTVDCGIRSPREAERAEALGIDLIISDHHQPGEELPDGFTVLCPKRGGDEYPDKDLAGVGIAYKIAQALAKRRPEAGVRAEDWLDLVALGTVADVVPLTGENRSLVRRGLQTMRSSLMQGRPGLYSLANVARVKVGRICATDIAFILGPRLNAAGRLDTAHAALNLLLAESVEQAGLLSQNLDNQNRERQDLTRKTQEEVLRLVQARDGAQDPAQGAAQILFAFDRNFNPGIVGLVASRLVEMFYRPAIVGHEEDGYTRASCRSIPEFHITRALDECRELLERHGGHALAAGFTVKNENVPELTARLRAIASRELSALDLHPVLRADLEIPLARLRADYVETVLHHLDMLQPTGQGNPEAMFVSRGLEVVRSWTVGTEKQHLRLKLRAGNIMFDAIAFRQGHWADAMPKAVDLLYQLEKNEYNGYESLQLNVRDLKPAGEPD
ncbi:MAG: single-stranded-DNA-specific exonuclease RecJ, partial [Chloroflexi bacterium]